MPDTSQALDRLVLFDPESARRLASLFTPDGPFFGDEPPAFVVEDIIWALAQEDSFGEAVARGYALLTADASGDMRPCYHRAIHRTGALGPTAGRMMADHLPPVLKTGDSRLRIDFFRVFDTLLQKGTYALKGPLKMIRSLLAEPDTRIVAAGLALLETTFAQPLSYNQSLRFTVTLPRAAAAFTTARARKMRQLTRIIQQDPLLADVFLTGMEKGLELLDPEALDSFVSSGLRLYQRNARKGSAFLSLSSVPAQQAYKKRRTAAALTEIASGLRRYLRARTGMPLTVAAAAAEPPPAADVVPSRVFAYCDRQTIYLPPTLSIYPRLHENIRLYKCLIKLEAGLIEFGTFDFDADKALARCRRYPSLNLPRRVPADDGVNDIERFCRLFADHDLAFDLFTLFEHGRIQWMLNRRYPGLAKSVRPAIIAENRRLLSDGRSSRLLQALYAAVTAGPPPAETVELKAAARECVVKARRFFRAAMSAAADAETSGLLAARIYADVRGSLAPQGLDHGEDISGSQTLRTPFNRRLRPQLAYDGSRDVECRAARIQQALLQQGVAVFRSDVRDRLMQRNGRISARDIRNMLHRRGRTPFACRQDRTDIRNIDFSFLDPVDAHPFFDPAAAGRTVPVGRVFRYHEWDLGLGDYRQAHVRVVERTMARGSPDFYPDILQRRQGLVSGMRRAFEVMKPEGLSILRQWADGDQFDDQALLDFVLDRKAGRTPSEHVYIKRAKCRRDVAVLILVDLSRSTANAAAGGGASVLDIEKESIVLLCEAIRAIGDRFAIAGFSGSGRSHVDYLKIKDFDEPVGDCVRRRIGCMAPQRNTRMGAAVRHAAWRLRQNSAAVRLLLILGDGFPNDLEYKNAFAVADTRKAVSESNAMGVHVRAITVNMAADPKLDALYGAARHIVITDARELPDRLPAIYSRLTKT